MKTGDKETAALKELGKKLRDLRSSQNLSQSQLADSIGISSRYLGEIEAGKRNLSLGVLHALAARLSITLPELLTVEDSQTRQDAIKQIMAHLDKLPLQHLLFIQRALRQFMEK